MNLPKKEDLVPALFAFGVAIATGRMLASSESLTVKRVVGRAIEGGLMCMCAGVALLIPHSTDVSSFALLGAGGLLAFLGRDGILAIFRRVRRGKED